MSASPFPQLPSRYRLAGGIGLIFLFTILSYIPVYSAGFIWDDDDHITNNTTLRTSDGLREIWLNPQSIPQYYPLTHTAFWIEYHLWGLNPLGYHVANVLFHAANASLLWILLARLGLPGAFAAAILFAVHPIGVETVAWATEQKTLLSALFYLLSFLALWRFYDAPPRGRWKMYNLALALFLCAMLSKTVACSLPAAVLLVLWWKGKPIQFRTLLQLTPFFAIGLALSRMTAHLEVVHVGAHGPAWDLSFAQRCLIAARAIWFYAGKIIWPVNLSFNYPRWNVDAGDVWQWTPLAAAVVLVIALWAARRRIGRGPLVAALFFAGTLFPALGFFNVYPMRYSFVADHFAYMASIAIFALVVGGATLFPSSGIPGEGSGGGWRGDAPPVANPLPSPPPEYRGRETEASPKRSRVPQCIVAIVVVGLGIATFLRAEAYHDPQTLWTRTLAANPDSAIAHYWVGKFLLAQGRNDEAMGQFTKATQHGSVVYEPDIKLGDDYLAKDQFTQARDWFDRATQLQPDSILAHQSLAFSLAFMHEYRRALAEYELAYRLHLEKTGIAGDAEERAFAVFAPDLPNPQTYAGRADQYALAGNVSEAEECDLKALISDPSYASVERQLEQMMRKSLFGPQSSDETSGE